MSIALAPVDLSAAQVGATGTLDWTNQLQTGQPIGVRAGRPTLRLYNESGVGLQIALGVSSDRLPAGAWVDVKLNGENKLIWTAEYVLAGAPVSLLLGTLYEAGEAIPQIPTLGNSPIGIGGTVATTTGQSVKNDGNAPGTAVVEATPSDQASASVTINNDASGFLKVLSANVLRVILSVVRGNSGAGKATVQLGDAGDTSITTLYGTVGAGSVVPAATVAGTLPAAQVGSGYPAGSIAGTLPASQVGSGYPAADVAAGTLASGVDLTTLNSDAGKLTSDGSGSVFAQGGLFFGPSGLQAELAVDSAGHFINLWPPNPAGTAYSIDFHPWSGSSNAATLHLDGATGKVEVFTALTVPTGTVSGARSAGGGAAGTTDWVGTTDPGASAGEGDTWAKA